MAEHIVHEQNSGTNTLIAIVLVLAIVILGVFLFRNGIGNFPSRNATIKVELPTGGNIQNPVNSGGNPTPGTNGQ